MLCDVLNLNLQTVFTQLNKSVRVLTTLINEKKKKHVFIYIYSNVGTMCMHMYCILFKSSQSLHGTLCYCFKVVSKRDKTKHYHSTVKK